jgi:hypothetical protein
MRAISQSLRCLIVRASESSHTGTPLDLLRRLSRERGAMAEEQQKADEGAPQADFSKKHPLETKWTLWFDNPQTRQTMIKYGQSLRSVYTFDCVEDFWW